MNTDGSSSCFGKRWLARKAENPLLEDQTLKRQVESQDTNLQIAIR